MPFSIVWCNMIWYDLQINITIRYDNEYNPLYRNIKELTTWVEEETFMNITYVEVL